MGELTRMSEILERARHTDPIPSHASLSSTTTAEAASAKSDTCERCGGFGWMRVDLPVGHPDFGKAILCECKRDEIWNWRWSQTWWAGFAKATIDDFRRLRIGDATMPELVRASLAAGRGLYLCGPVGSGKTHLAMAVLRESWPEWSGYAEPMVDMLEEIKRGFDKDSGIVSEDVFRRYMGLPLLVIDDLGKERVSDWVATAIYHIVNDRWAQRHKVMTIITSNYSRTDLEGVYRPHGEAIASRIAGMCDVLELTGADRRIGRG